MWNVMVIYTEITEILMKLLFGRKSTNVKGEEDTLDLLLSFFFPLRLQADTR